MGMQKIFLYINTLGRGGAERVISQLANHFSNEHYNVTLITSYPVDGEYSVLPAVNRVYLESVESKHSRLVRNISRIRKLRRLCKKDKPDILLSFMQESNVRAILATIALKTKTIVSVRNDPNQVYVGISGTLVGKCLLPMADGCVFQTAQARQWFPRKLQKKSAIIANEVAEAFFHVNREDITRNVISVGRLCGHKNHVMLIRAFARIAAKHPECNMLIYGDGDCREQVEQQISLSTMENRVFLMGKTTQVEHILAKASVFVLPSDFEGMPNALLEAMAVGVPSISTDCPCGGPAMLIRHGENGLLVPVGDETAMADAIDRMLSDTEFAQRLGQQAKADAESYRPNKVFQTWKAYVEGILNGNDKAVN